ncbi:unnamed protein product [Durusdinium trenchii]|uniref:Uncharacterized protein n=1 Tax=Durusdinium trenchii TaxID=1381693 RepID=A0ABP0IW59_9DINO
MSCRGRQRSFTNWSFDSVRFKVFVVLFLSAMFCPECIQQYSTLPTQAATTLHVRLLTPQGESSDGWELCAASAIAPVFPLDPHSGALLAEVRREHLRFEYTAKVLNVWITKKCVRAIGRLRKANVPFEGSKKQPVVSTKSYFNEEDFQRSSNGTKNVQRVMNQMRLDFQTHGGQLEEHKGMVKLGKSDVVVRPLGHEGAACSSPCSRDDSAKFRRWLIQLYRESEQPVMAT